MWVFAVYLHLLLKEEDKRESQEESFKDRKKKGGFSPKLIWRNQSMMLKAEKSLAITTKNKFWFPEAFFLGRPHATGQ